MSFADMGMVKVTGPDAWDFNEPQLQLVKCSSRGLIGDDFKTFVKRAGWRLADAVRNIQLNPGEELIHNIALGAKEYYGANRNGDAFRDSVCQNYHPTFTKFARWYRNHQNKDMQKSYGIIKLSDYNDAMKRVELLIALNGTKEAADRNGGLVADKELDKLHRGLDIPTSMACKVAYDICPACSNRAKHRGEYCMGEDEGGHCKRGGVRNRMCMVHNDGYMNHVENPEPLFFDISDVPRGADRTSWAVGLVKAASFGTTKGGAALAEALGVDFPTLLYTTVNLWPTRLEKLATELAKLELKYDDGKPEQWDIALSPEWHKAATFPSNYQPQQLLAALTMQKVALPVGPWLQLVHGQPEWASADMIASSLPGIYGRMLADGSIKEASTLLPSMQAKVPFELFKWATKLAEDFSLDLDYLEARSLRAALYGIERPEPRRPQLVKTAGAAETLARGYALYKLAFLQALSDRDEDFDLTKALAIRQNYVS